MVRVWIEVGIGEGAAVVNFIAQSAAVIDPRS